jgi:CDP-diacylglycerol--glycerol-3-phosphate 3-phosphatidyltransferase
LVGPRGDDFNKPVGHYKVEQDVPVRGPSNSEADRLRWLNWPNAVTSLRIIGSPGLVLLALGDLRWWLGFFVLILVFTEWLDGFLARGWYGESATGARLDTIADALFYSSLFVAIAILNPTLVREEASWIAAAVGSYLCNWLASWIKFRCLPSYHTWAAKAVWLVVGAGILALLARWSAWPFRIAMLCVVFTNIEAIAITMVLSKCRVNVPSVWHVRRSRR